MTLIYSPVPPSAYTTFYVGGLANACALRKDVSILLHITNMHSSLPQPSIRPHFECYFTASYGLTREQLEEANFLIKSSDPIRYNPQRKVGHDRCEEFASHAEPWRHFRSRKVFHIHTIYIPVSRHPLSSFKSRFWRNCLAQASPNHQKAQ